MNPAALGGGGRPPPKCRVMTAGKVGDGCGGHEEIVCHLIWEKPSWSLLPRQNKTTQQKPKHLQLLAKEKNVQDTVFEGEGGTCRPMAGDCHPRLRAGRHVGAERTVCSQHEVFTYSQTLASLFSYSAPCLPSSWGRRGPVLRELLEKQRNWWGRAGFQCKSPRGS